MSSNSPAPDPTGRGGGVISLQVGDRVEHRYWENAAGIVTGFHHHEGLALVKWDDSQGPTYHKWLSLRVISPLEQLAREAE